MKRYILIAFCCCLGALTIIGQDSEMPETLKTIESHSTEISFPEDWDSDDTGMMGTKFIVFVPDATSDAFRENINLVIQPLGAVVEDLTPMIAATEEQLKTIITNFELVNSEQKEGYYALEYTGKQGEFDLHWKQRLYLEGENAYILTLTTSIEDFTQCEEQATRVMDTFKVLKK